MEEIHHEDQHIFRRHRFFQDDEGKLAVQAETISQKNLLETGCKHHFFFSGPNGMLFSYQEFTQLLRFPDICPVIDVDDIFTWLM